jgi:hypothetical protein
MHKEAYAYVRTQVLNLSFDNVVEFGSLDINGSVRGLFDTDSYYGIDLQEGPGVDEIADAATWESPEGEVDCIVCCEVLEHAPNVLGIIANAYRNLGQNGLLIITCATNPRQPHSAIDGGPKRANEWYENVEAETLRRAFKNSFQIVDLTVSRERGDLYCVARKLT